jgi:AcrR family transcriptional regulator
VAIDGAKALAARALHKEPAMLSRGAQREFTRRKLLSSARQLFRARGVEPVAMEDIAQTAKVSRATVYLHFAGKPVLLEALMLEDWASQLRLFERLHKVDFTDSESIAGWVRQVASGMRAASDSFAIYRAALGQNASLTVLHHQHIAALAQELRHACGEDAAQTSDARLRSLEAELIVAEIEHFATASVVGWSELDTAKAVGLVVERLRVFAAQGC